MKDMFSAIGAVIAALIALTGVALNIVTSKKLQQQKEGFDRELLALKNTQDQQNAETNARRAYEFEARKRLYNEFEPLLFQFQETASNAYYRILGITERFNEGVLLQKNFLGSQGYYSNSTLYKLLAPLAIFKLMRERLTGVDLQLVARMNLQYRVIKQIYLLWTDDFIIAKLMGVEYDPNNDDWQTLREQSPAKHWRQGFPMGVLDILIDLLLVKDGENQRLLTFGEFEEKIYSAEYPREKVTKLFNEVFIGFNITNRPVLSGILYTQSKLYQQLFFSMNAAVTPLTAFNNQDGSKPAAPKQDEIEINLENKVGELKSALTLAAKIYINQYLESSLEQLHQNS